MKGCYKDSILMNTEQPPPCDQPPSLPQLSGEQFRVVTSTCYQKYALISSRLKLCPTTKLKALSTALSLV